MDEAYYASQIRTCTISQDVSHGRKLHSQLLSSSSSCKRYLSNLLLEMYGKCGCPAEAAQVFHQIEQPNLFSWNLLLAAYALNGHLQQAREVFDKMPETDTVSWNTMISAYGNAGEISEARFLFEKLPKKNTVSWNAIISAYAQNGYLHQAKSLFDNTPEPNSASWNTMLTSYSQSGHLEKANQLFEQMPVKTVVSWTAMISVHSTNGDLHKAEEIFHRMPDRNVVSWTTMVQAYAQNGHVTRAREIFDAMPLRNTVSWNVMLLAYARKGYLDEAESLFNVIPKRNTVSWNAMIQTYITNEHLEKARRMFDSMSGELRDVVSWTSMVAAYARHGQVDEAEKLFNRMPVKNTVSWNTMISAYAENSLLDKAESLFNSLSRKGASTWTAMMAAYVQCSMHREALHLFKLMVQDGVQPDALTYTTALTVCSFLAASQPGKLIHAECLNSKLESDIPLGNSLINFYASCGSMQQARAEFDSMQRHDVKSWTCLISGYTRNDQVEQVMDVFRCMDQAGYHPDNFTFAAVYEACGRRASLEQAKMLHSAFETSQNQPDLVLENALIDLYAKCASIQGAEGVFEQMRVRDLVTWSTMVTAYVQNGLPEDALRLFSGIISEGLMPDHINFVTVLTACSHLGQLERACEYLVSMCYDYSLEPKVEHFHCIVDLLARAGRVAEAEELISSMPYVPGEVAWMSLLGACRTHGTSGAVKCEMDLEEAASYVMLSNVNLVDGDL